MKGLHAYISNKSLFVIKRLHAYIYLPYGHFLIPIAYMSNKKPIYYDFHQA